MKLDKDLKSILERIDHKGYSAYRETRGEYEFENYILNIEHVQGDPFASSSQISITVNNKNERNKRREEKWKKKKIKAVKPLGL